MLSILNRINLLLKVVLYLKKIMVMIIIDNDYLLYLFNNIHIKLILIFYYFIMIC